MTRSARALARTTPAGLTVWHVEDYSVPVVSVEFAFEGGAAEDPEGRTGLAHLMAGLLDEGAAGRDADAFQEALEERAIELNFDASRDRIHGSLRMIDRESESAFALLGDALSAPRFDADAIDRVRAQVISSIKRDESDPQSRARETLQRLAFPDHPYGRPAEGRIPDVQAIDRAALVAQHRRLIVKANAAIVVVGAIDGASVDRGIDRAFGALPARSDRAAPGPAQMQGAGHLEIVDLDIPQSTLVLALPGLARRDPDFMAGSIVNHILGGGSFTSRLWMEIREKRGLAYSVWSMLAPRRSASLFLAGTATGNERVAESLRLMREEIARMAESGPTAEEFDKALRYMTGSYALRFDTSRKIAHQYLDLRLDGFDIDYVDRRNDELRAVSPADTRRVARALFADAKPLVVAAGRPQGLV